MRETLERSKENSYDNEITKKEMILNVKMPFNKSYYECVEAFTPMIFEELVKESKSGQTEGETKSALLKLFQKESTFFSGFLKK